MQWNSAVVNILIIFYWDIIYQDIKFYIRKLIINSKYDLIVINISSAFINISLNIDLEKFVLSYVFSTFSYNSALQKFVNYAPMLSFLL